MRSFRSGPLALTGLLALAACAGEPLGPGTGPDEATASIRVSANVANTPIDLLVVTVSAEDIVIPAVFNLSVVGGTASGTLHIPPGTARVFTVEAFDAEGGVTHDGSATRDVQRGQNAPLAIPLTPRSGQVPITISFGDFSVEVSPAAQLLDLSTTTTVQLAVTVVDGQGAVVSSPQVLWATTNPARATVSATGLVTGLLPGEVDIVATYNGIAGISHLTLSGAAPDIYYADFDVDGFGDPGQSIAVPTGFPAPDGYVTDSGDCNDTDSATYPGAQELLDASDNDCNGIIDEGIAMFVDGYADNDLDGWGAGTVLSVPVVTGPGGSYDFPGLHSPISGDCNDAESSINPGATEIPDDGIDSNCDGVID